MGRKPNTSISFFVIFFVLFFIVIFNVLYAADKPVFTWNVLSFHVKTDKSSYFSGEIVRICLSIRNNGEKSIGLGSLEAGFGVYGSSTGKGWIGICPLELDTWGKTISPHNELKIDLPCWNTHDAVPDIYIIKVTISHLVMGKGPVVIAATQIQVEIK